MVGWLMPMRSQRHTALNSAMQGAAVHADQRDGAAWFTEWLTLPQMVLVVARGLATANHIANALVPDPKAMSANIDATGGAVFAEALTFELARAIPRPEAQATVKTLVGEANSRGMTFQDVAKENLTDIDIEKVFSATHQLGTAPEEARAFARACREKDE